MKTCETCRFWSEKAARMIGDGPLEAVCLANALHHPDKTSSHYSGQFTSVSMSCDHYIQGSPIDGSK